MSPIQVKRDVLLGSLRAVHGAVDARHQLAVLGNVLFESREGRLFVTATDAGMQVTAQAEARNATGVQIITASAQKLLCILGQLPEGESVTFDIQGTRLRIQCGEIKFSLQTLPGGDFPKMTAAGRTAIEAALPQRELKRMLQLAQSAMSQRDPRHYLNGALLRFGEGLLTVVTTDTYRLAVASYPLGGNARPNRILLPRKAAIELSKLLSASDDPVNLRVFENQAAFNFSHVEVISALLGDGFPDYQRVIPTEFKSRFCVNRRRLHQALQRVAILVNEKFRGVRWTIANERLRVEAANGAQEEAEDGIAVNYMGESIDLGFNIDYVTDALTSVESDEIECAFAGSTMQITVPSRTDFKYIITSMRL
jgi:DNA polymerase III subunit beta